MRIGGSGDTSVFLYAVADMGSGSCYKGRSPAGRLICVARLSVFFNHLPAKAVLPLFARANRGRERIVTCTTVTLAACSANRRERKNGFHSFPSCAGQVSA